MTVDGMDRPVIPDPHEQPVMTVEDVARVLGVSRSSAYTAVGAGQIPSVRIGRRICVPTARLRDMLGLSDA